MSRKHAATTTAPRRRFTADQIEALIKTYEELPPDGGHRTAWLRDQRIASAQMSQWRTRRRRRTRPGDRGNLGGVVVALPAVVDSPTVDGLVKQLEAQRAALDRAIAALKALGAPRTVGTGNPSA